MNDELFYTEATELARRIREKEVSPVEVLNAHLERIEAVNPTVNAIVAMVDTAREQAKAAEDAVMRGDDLGPLHGVPFTIKDCVDTAGVRTVRGSKLYADYVPSTDATVVTRLKRAGGIFMAKTNMPEFALWGQTDNLVFGRTANPWSLDRISGGSSGGEAAALAAGLSPLGIGSDVGGSIRGPAHHCGVVGLKATHGRVPLTGHWPDTRMNAMHVGPMARTVRDVALELSIIAGPDGIDPYAPPVPVPGVPDLDRPPTGIRVGWNVGKSFEPMDPDVRNTVVRAATALGESGFQVEEVSPRVMDEVEMDSIFSTVSLAETQHYVKPRVEGREAELTHYIKERLAEPEPTIDQYLDGLRAWEEFRQGIASYFQDYDLLICPTMSVPAYPFDAEEITLGGKRVSVKGVGKGTTQWNLTGSPAVSVPFGWSSDGLPIGVQVVGRHFDEPTVLLAAAALERMNETATRRPTL